MPDRRRARAVAVGLALVLLVALFSLNYTVKRGDTLSEIARDHGVGVSDLVDANNIKNPDLIFPGQVLVIPGQAPAKSEPKEVIHVVKRGETLAKIASAYKVSASSIAKANDISNPNVIRPGQKLVIPGAADGVSSGSTTRTDRFHIVKNGENLANVASKYDGVTSDQIAKSNGIVDGIIYSGTRLFLDGPVYSGRGGGSKVTYTVKSGDTLGGIAHAHKVTTKSIIDLNNITNPNVIRVGQELIIKTAGWTCPVEGSTFFNDWGFPRGSSRYHEGNDLFVKRGTPVRAPVSGTVKQVIGSIGGKQVNLTGEDGVVYLGSHLDDFGQSGKVSAGTIIGYVGNTGNAAGSSPHLHFGMYLSGAVINPYPTLLEHGCR